MRKAVAANLITASPAHRCSCSCARISFCRCGSSSRTQEGMTTVGRSRPTTAGPVSRDHSTGWPSSVPGFQPRRRCRKSPVPVRAYIASPTDNASQTSRSIPLKLCSTESDGMVSGKSPDAGVPTRASTAGSAGKAPNPSTTGAPTEAAPDPAAPPPKTRAAVSATVPTPTAAHTHLRPPSRSFSAASPATSSSAPTPIDQSIHAAIIVLPPSQGVRPAACGACGRPPATAVPLRQGVS